MEGRGKEARRPTVHLVNARLPPASDRSDPAGLAEFVDHPVQPTEYPQSKQVDQEQSFKAFHGDCL